MTAPMLLLSLLAAAPPAAGPSLAVLSLQAKTGVSPDVAELLTTALTNLARDAGGFGSVVGAKELEARLGFEQQRLALGCDSSSCLAEMAGALGVDYLLTGSLGRLGATWMLSLTLLDARDAQRAHSAMRSIEGGAEDVLLKALPGLVDELLQKTGQAKAGAVVAAAPAVAPDPPAAASGKGPLPAVMKGIGAAGLAGAGLAGVIGAVGALAAMATWTAVFIMPDAGLGIGFRGLLMSGGYYGLWALCAVGVLAALALGVGGGGALAGGIVAG